MNQLLRAPLPSPLVRMERVGSLVVGLALLAAVMPGPAKAQGCSFAMAFGVAVPTGGVPDPDRREVKLSTGPTGRLGLEGGSKSIRFGVDLESTALGSQPAATLGYGMSLLGLLGRFGSTSVGSGRWPAGVCASASRFPRPGPSS